mgnify:CR=1 FL=1
MQVQLIQLTDVLIGAICHYNRFKNKSDSKAKREVIELIKQRSINDIKKLLECSSVSDLVLVPQVKNLEDEIVESCSIRHIKELLGSKSNTEFKSDFIKATNLANKLKSKSIVKFNVELNESDKIITLVSFNNDNMKVVHARMITKENY